MRAGILLAFLLVVSSTHQGAAAWPAAAKLRKDVSGHPLPKSMKYDFDSIPDRSGTGSMKWDNHKVTDPAYVPLSTADMEFPTAPPIRQALSALAENRILGYARPTPAYFDAVCGWMKRRHNFDVDRQWIITTPGVVDALAILVEAATKPGEAVLILTPAYYPFELSVISKSRKVVHSTLIDNDGHYEIDFADLEAKASRKNVTALMFCSPHNPTGRVWTREELGKVASICLRHGLFIIDDEIHNDIIMPGCTHTLMATLGEKILDHIAVCTAPSKTFNLAGLQCSNIIIPNAAVRARALSCSLMNMNQGLNIFAYEACIAAYNQCEDWLEEMLTVIQGNAEYVKGYLAEHFPQIRVLPLEGTYLLWLDMRQTGLTHKEMKRLLEENHLYLDNGEMFGDAGRGYQRINLACARLTLERAMERFRSGMEAVYARWETEGRPYHKTLVPGEKLEHFVYDSARGLGRTLTGGDRPTLLVFGTTLDSPVTRALLGVTRALLPALNRLSCRVKFVVQSDLESVTRAQADCPFELIADPHSKLYDLYNVFEADGVMNMVGDDKLVGLLVGKDVKRFLRIDAFSQMISTYLDPDDGPADPDRRPLQLPAFVCVDGELTVTYSHYCSTLSGLPNPADILKGIRGK